jgi:hypothetical protein
VWHYVFVYHAMPLRGSEGILASQPLLRSLLVGFLASLRMTVLSSPHLQLTVVIPNGEQRNEESHMFELSETGFSICFWFTWFKNITNIQ